MALVTLPRAFVFRATTDDPHPMPWLRMLLSCAMGDALFPHPQWQALASAWRATYPLPEDLPAASRRTIDALCDTLPQLAYRLARLQPPRLQGESLADALRVDTHPPDRLRAAFRPLSGSFERVRELPPSLAFALIGQARFDGRLTPEGEGRLVSDLLTFWALRREAAHVRAAARSSRAPMALAV